MNTNVFFSLLLLLLFYVKRHYIIFIDFATGNVHSIAKKQVLFEYPNLVHRRNQKVHTKVIDAKLNKVYIEKINSTLEYIFQYSYPQGVSIL